MKMITVKLQGVEVQAALLSPAVMKKVEDGFLNATLQIESIGRKDELMGSEGIQAQCQVVIDYVKDIFGADAARKVFGEETDYLTCLDVMEEMQTMYPDQVGPIIRERNKRIRENAKKAKGEK